MKNQKVGLTAKNWMLSILGIIVFSLVIILPPVFRVVFKEEVVTPPTNEPALPITTTTCYLENIIREDNTESMIEEDNTENITEEDNTENIIEKNYTESETLVFEHRGTSIEQYTRRTEKKYTDPTIYDEERQNYGSLVPVFSILSGYRYSVTPNDSLFLLTITEIYDLTSFENSTFIIPGDSEATTVTSEYQLHDSITKIQEELTTNGYVCTSGN